MSSSTCSIIIHSSNQTGGNLDSTLCSGHYTKWCSQDFMYENTCAHMQEMMPFWWCKSGRGGVTPWEVPGPLTSYCPQPSLNTTHCTMQGKLRWFSIMHTISRSNCCFSAATDTEILTTTRFALECARHLLRPEYGMLQFLLFCCWEPCSSPGMPRFAKDIHREHGDH